MVVAISSNTFTIREMKAGTVPSAWYVGLGITTLHAFETEQVGSNAMMLTVVWE